MEMSKFTEGTSAQQKLDSLKEALNTSFAELPDIQRCWLASEFSTMKQRAMESIDYFAYRFKNNLHRLSKLGEAVETNSPQFIMSQFIFKTKTNIQKNLVLKAEEYKDFSEIIEAAKRIKRFFSREEVTLNPTNHHSTHSVLSILLQLLLYPMSAAENLFATNAVLRVISKAAALEKQEKYPLLIILAVAMKCVACGTNISSHHAPYRISHANIVEHINALFAPNQAARHSFTIMYRHVPVANACDLQTLQGTHPEPSSSITSPTPGTHSQPTPPLFMMPTLPTSSSELSFNQNRQLNYKKLEKPIPLNRWPTLVHL